LEQTLVKKETFSRGRRRDLRSTIARREMSTHVIESSLSVGG
jgi:hypothetical protein